MTEGQTTLGDLADAINRSGSTQLQVVDARLRTDTLPQLAATIPLSIALPRLLQHYNWVALAEPPNTNSQRATHRHVILVLSHIDNAPAGQTAADTQIADTPVQDERPRQLLAAIEAGDAATLEQAMRWTAAAHALSPQQTTDTLLTWMTLQDDDRLRRTAIAAVGELREAAALPALDDLLRHDDQQLDQYMASNSLAQIATPEAEQLLLDRYQNGTAVERHMTAVAAYRYGSPRLKQTLVDIAPRQDLRPGMSVNQTIEYMASQSPEEVEVPVM